MPKFLGSKLLHRPAVMRQRTNKKLTNMKCEYKDHRFCHVRAKSTFRFGQPVYVEHPVSSVRAAKRVGTDSYSKLLPRRLGPYCVLSPTDEPMKIDEEGLPSTTFCDRA